jgi:hypothetical protein
MHLAIEELKSATMTKIFFSLSVQYGYQKSQNCMLTKFVGLKNQKNLVSENLYTYFKLFYFYILFRFFSYTFLGAFIKHHFNKFEISINSAFSIPKLNT